MAKSLKVDLVIIDPQNDFCDGQTKDANGKLQASLYVKGAEMDMANVAKFIRRVGSRLNDIHVTLDSHHLNDVAHPNFWKDSKGAKPGPFTVITAADIESGKWTPFRPSLIDRMLKYTKTLEKNGKYPLMIWPPHCLIGTWGAQVFPAVNTVLQEYCEKEFAIIDYVTKGSNIYTEHYSAVKAEVPDPADPSTQVNAEFIKVLMEADEIAVVGEAGSHCVANTVRDIATEFKDDSLVKKIVLLEGCYSPVPTPDAIKMQEDFIKEMTAKGMRIEKVSDYLA